MSIYVLVEFKTKTEKVSEFHELMKVQLPKTRTQSGCESIELVQNQNEPNHFFILQKWASKQDHVNHVKVREEEGLRDRVRAMLDDDIHVSYFNCISLDKT